jgi:hypothetical protein
MGYFGIGQNKKEIPHHFDRVEVAGSRPVRVTIHTIAKTLDIKGFFVLTDVLIYFNK